MKTAISIPDKLFNEAECLAKRLQKSRSQLYSEAIAEYTARHSSEEEIIEDINRALEEMGEDPELDAFVAEAARRTLMQIEW